MGFTMHLHILKLITITKIMICILKYMYKSHHPYQWSLSQVLQAFQKQENFLTLQSVKVFISLSSKQITLNETRDKLRETNQKVRLFFTSCVCLFFFTTFCLPSFFLLSLKPKKVLAMSGIILIPHLLYF